MKKNQITLIATDLDGTFLNSKKEVSEINRKAIQQLKYKGILFGIASGRPIDTIRPMIADWGIEKDVSFILGMNGGTLYDLRRRDKEDYHLISGAVVLEAIDFFADLDVQFQVLIGPTRYVNKSDEDSLRHAELFGEVEIAVDLHEFLKNRDINKLIIRFKLEDRELIEERAKLFHDDRVVGFFTADDLYEYVDPNINKGFGIKKLAKHYGVPLSSIMAFGDAPNDKEMVELVGTGVCMANGSEETKSVANYVTELTNDESAVGHFINSHILEEE